MFSSEEKTYLILLSASILIVLLKSLLNKKPYELWNPLSFVSIFFIYYTVLGPIMNVINEDTFLRNVEHRDYFALGWKCALISYLSILAGYYAFRSTSSKKINFRLDATFYKRIGFKLLIFCIILLFIYGGAGAINKVKFMDNRGSSGEGYGGGFSAYLMQAINFFIGAVVLFLIYGLKSKKYMFFWIVFIIAVSIFINEAFRYRLVIVALSCISIFYIYKQKKPNLVLMGSIAMLFVFFMGVIEYSRAYGHGLNLTNVETMNNEDILEGGLNESAVFMATSYLINEVNEGRISYTNQDMFVNAIASPIPRTIWRGKPQGEYFLGTMSIIYGPFSAGQAMLFYGEYYLSYGWVGLVLFSFLLGVLFRKFWNWFVVNKENELALATIAVFNSFIYVIISRGYLSQVLTLFFFTVFPLLFIIRLVKKRYIK